MISSTIDELALGFTEGVGIVLARNFLSHFGSAEQVFKAPKGKLLQVEGVGNKVAEAISKKEAFAKAEKEIQLAEKFQTSILFFTNPHYPKRLRHIYDAPPILYYKGNVDLNAIKVLSIVGTRQASPYGELFLEKFTEQVAPHLPLIVSGLAYGIDSMAHKYALKNNLSTIGVMANGIDIVYPASHKKLALQMLEKEGGLLTENPFGTKPDAPRFPARNRIIAGMADAILVVEALEKGGALVTAEIANSYNKDIFAVPGNFNHPASKGCNNLIKQNKAHLLTSIEDLEYIMSWNKTNTPHKVLDLTQLNSHEKKIIEFLQNRKNKEIFIDELGWALELPQNTLNATLLNLELQGIIKSLPGKKYTLVY